MMSLMSSKDKYEFEGCFWVDFSVLMLGIQIKWVWKKSFGSRQIRARNREEKIVRTF